MTSRGIFIARYGQRECALVEHVGPFDMDITPGDGVRSAHELGGRLCSAPAASGCAAIKHILTSPFLRAVHTAHAVADVLDLPVLVEVGLTEWLTPSLVGRDNHQPANGAEHHATGRFPRVDPNYRSVCSGAAVAQFPESEAALLRRCAAVVACILSAFPDGSVLLVSHAPCNLGFALALEAAARGTPLCGGAEGLLACIQSSALRPWPLGGLTQFKIDCDGRVNLVIEGDTSHLTGTLGDEPYAVGIQRWTLPCLEQRAGPAEL